MSAMACLVMGGSHFYFGPGEEAIQLTQEYIHRTDLVSYKILKLIL